MDLGPQVDTILERTCFHLGLKNHCYHTRELQSLFDNPEFIQVGFHISQFFTVAIDTKIDRANTKVLYSALEYALTHLNVSIF
jgi:hypothetical protein